MNISVSYYDEYHKVLFATYHNESEIRNLVEKLCEVNKDEFLAYMMFTFQKDKDGFRTYDELQKKIESRIGDCDSYLQFNNNSVQAKMPSKDMSNDHYTEYIGVGLGLSVISSLHNLTKADWAKIPESRMKTFDFRISIAASTTYYIELENKGSVIDNNEFKLSSVSNHKNDILDKKTANNTGATSRNLRYGTIGVLDQRTDSIAKVWLVDPPANDYEDEPRKFKLLTRLRYYLTEFAHIGVKEEILDALEKRINEIETAKNYKTFDGVQLDYNYPVVFHRFMENFYFVAINGNEAFGRVFFIKLEQQVLPFIVAFPKALMILILEQNFNEILNYKFQGLPTEGKVVKILIKLYKEAKSMYKLPQLITFNQIGDNGRLEAIIQRPVSFTSDGRIFGLVKDETYE